MSDNPVKQSMCQARHEALDKKFDGFIEEQRDFNTSQHKHNGKVMKALCGDAEPGSPPGIKDVCESNQRWIKSVRKLLWLAMVAAVTTAIGIGVTYALTRKGKTNEVRIEHSRSADATDPR